MIFADLLFLFAFLPLNLLLYFIFKNTMYRNVVLVGFSLLFYAWGEPVMILLLLATTEINRIFALFIEKQLNIRNAENDRLKSAKAGFRAKMYTAAAIAITLTSLAVFKYSGLFALPFRPSLPIGISFYSFQIISYLVDLYKGKIPAQKSRMKFLMYVSLYPQLIAGPIVRYEHIQHDIDNRKIKPENVSEGITRFVIGLAKKVLIANQIGAAGDTILGGNVSALPVMGAWLGILFFALQIYYDFSGYSDMAIGLGRIFGFKFPENFNYPYISQSISEFWRRWHMTLGGFFRDYVYIPLGGNRKRVWFNLAVVWFLTGLWHGASWNFALWGMYFGVLIMLEKAFLLKIAEKVPAAVKIPVTFILVTFGWSLFYFTDFEVMRTFIASLIGLNGNGFYDIVSLNLLYDRLFIVIFAVIFCAPVYRYIEKGIKKIKLGWAIPFANAALIILCAIMLVGETNNPFLYYRF
ncbi:MAG: MBOAT family protein [Oscillospiraceae bacterium]|nr:MBOAT family protein [Oscillospiraceae bacterium]